MLTFFRANKTRFKGVFFLIHTLMPLLIATLLFFVTTNVFFPRNAQKLANIYYHEIDVLNRHVEMIGGQALELYDNAKEILDNFDKMKNDILDLKAKIIDDASEFWQEIKSTFKDAKEEFEQFKKFLLEKVQEYLDFILATKDKILDFTNNVLAYKDELVKFVDDLKKQLEPLNDMAEAIEEIDVFGVFEAFTFDFPSLPPFPVFPVIDWSGFEINLEPINKEINRIKKDLGKEISGLTEKFKQFKKMPDIDVDFLKGANLKEQLINPIINLGPILNSYWDEIKKAQIMVNDELNEAKQMLKPWLKALILALLFWGFMWFLLYLYNLRRNLKMALSMIKGKEIDLTTNTNIL